MVLARALAAAITALAIGTLGTFGTPAEASESGRLLLDVSGLERGTLTLNPLIGERPVRNRKNPLLFIQASVELDGPWRYSPGDDASRAEVEFDDSGWTIRPTILSDWPSDERFTGVGWFRLRLKVAPELRGRALGLIFFHVGNLDVYLNGTRVVSLHGSGSESASFDPIATPLVLDQEEYVMAVRLEGKGLDRLRSMHLPTGLIGGVVDLDRYLPINRKHHDNTIKLTHGFLGAALTLALLHFFMFILLKEKRENLLFALDVLAVGGIIWASNSVSGATSVDQMLFRLTLFQWSVIGTSIFGLLAAYSIFLDKLPRHAWIFIGLAPVFAVATLRLTLWPAYVFALTALGEQTRLIIDALIKKKPGSRIVGIGSAVFYMCAAYQMLGGLGFIELRDPSVYIYGFAALVIAMSFYLANRFAGTSRELTLQLVDNLRKEKELEEARKLQQVLDQLKAAQAQLVQSEKMASLGQLVAGVAHEINTPVGAIHSVHDSMTRALAKLKLELANACPKDLEENPKLKASLKVLEDATKVIESGSTRVTEIVRRLRSFARLDEAELKKVDIHEGIEDTLVLMQHELKRGVKITKNFGTIPPIACYPSQLNQVFLNLLINARQAIAGEGEITITTSVEGEWAVVKIADSGVGIPPENLKRVFDPGFTTKGVGVGTGLGLSICYQIVQHHHGDIRVDSEPGRGTTFTVRLPMNL